MTRNTFVKLCGWALPVGAVSLTLGFLASNRPDYNPDNIRSLPIDRYANASETFLITFGFLLCVLGMVGILVRYGEAAGQWARLALGAGAVSGLIAAAGVIVNALSPDDSVGWSMFYVGMTLMFGGLLVFGVSCIRRKLLPRWNGLPFLAAVWLPTAVLGTFIYQAVTGSWLEMPDLVGQLLMLGSLGGLALLGLVMLTDDRAPVSQTPAT